MREFDYYVSLVGSAPKAVEPIIAYYAYKNGKTSCFSTKVEALEFSNLIEETIANRDEVCDNLRRIARHEELAAKHWNIALRKEYDYLSDELFDLCLAEAWNHHEDYDDVTYFMESIVPFAGKVLTLP